MNMEERRILVVGLVCLDQVTVVDNFPVEDTDQRSLDQYRSRGGNASNSCTVLSHIGLKCEFLGTLARSKDTDLILEEFRALDVDCSHCPVYDNHITPNSVVIASRNTGSRTIIHTNLGLPELSPQQFENLDLSKYCWIHLEGRNRENILTISQWLHNYNQHKTLKDRVRFSVEVEKVGRDFEAFIPWADVVFISKDVALSHSCSSIEEAVQLFKHKLKPGAGLVVAWGDQGAGGWDGQVFTCPAHPPAEGVVDSLGAGDTFNAAVIGCLSRGVNLRESVRVGCAVAGEKVGFRGFHRIHQTAKPYLPWTK